MTKATRFSTMLAHLKANAKTEDDKELVNLFETHETRVSQHFEDCLPEASHWNGKWDPKLCTRADWHGPGFHKGFRQADITDSSEADIRIWKLLSEGDTCFWDAHNESMQDN